MSSAMTAPDPETAELSPLKRAYLALERMEARCRALEAARSEPIAVVGMACRMPGGADTPDRFWELLRSGTEAIRDIPEERWDVDGYYDPDPAAPGKMSTRRGGYLRERIDGFDPQFFGISPREAETMDPQQRLLLEVTSEALERAAQVEDRLAGSDTGVFVGITSHDYADFHLAGQDPRLLGTHAITGNTHNAAAGRLSYCFGFQGPCMAVDTACSSSLVALHLACRSLQQGECRRALAGGVNLILSPVAGIALSQGRVLAADGRCRAFDAAASGMVRGEGCAVVVLKRLSDAREDGDDVLAVIRGTAVNQDGPSSGLTVPNGPSQEALLRRALRHAGLEPGDVDYLEAHGTGTPLGDPIELQALANVFGGTRDRPLLLGSVKTNIGHLEACAGLAGLIKVVLALRQGEIPPQLHFDTPTPHLPWSELPFLVPTEARSWARGSRPRRAGVSSFGFSGVNAHAVLEEAPPAGEDAAAAEAAERPLHLFALSGRTEDALRQVVQNLAEHLERHPELRFADACFSANAGRAHAAHRLAVVSASAAEAGERLRAFLEGRPAPGTEHGTATAEPRIAFLFTGQGAQHPGMGRALFEAQPGFRRRLLQCEEILRPEVPRPLLEVMHGDDTSLLDETAYAQPALFALGYALAELWQSWGVRPALVMGHSLGEYVAACVAGVFSLEEGLRLVAARGRLMQDLPREGGMLAAFAPAAMVEQAIGPDGTEVTIAAHNGREEVVVSGHHAALARVAARLQAAGIRTRPLQASHAFHSSLMDPVLDAFERRMGEVRLSPPRIGLVSNLLGGPASAEVANPGYWRRHLREPVRFAQGIAAAREQGCTAFLEIGPRPVLLGLAQQSVQGEELAFLPSLRPGTDDWRQMLGSLADLYRRGAKIDWRGFDRDHRRRRVTLPTTPFQRQRCWLDRPQAPSVGATTDMEAGSGHPLLGHRLDLAGIPEPCFQSRIACDAPVYLQDHKVFGKAVLPAAAYFELAIAAASTALGWDRLAVEEVVFQQPLRLPERQSVALQTRLVPAGPETCAFEIHGRAGEGWIRHAAGRLSRLHGSETAAAPQLAALRAEVAEPVDVAAIYRRAAACGVELGPRFQALRRAWSHGATALGEIALPDTLRHGAGAYRMHPVLLDAALQAMGAAFLDRDGAEAYLPVALDRLRVLCPAGVSGWSCARVTRIKGAREHSLRVDVLVLTEDGALAAAIEGLHLTRADRAQPPAPAVPDVADWLYGVEWQPRRLVAEGPDYLPGAEEIDARILPELSAAHAEPPEMRGYGGFLEAVEALSVTHIVVALRRLGWTMPSGERATTGELMARLGIAGRHHRLFGRLLAILAEVGILAPRGVEAWQVRATAPPPQDDAAAVLRRYPEAAAELTLLQRCGTQLAEVLTGACDPLPLLFPAGDAVTAAHLYRDSAGARATNRLVRQLIADLLAGMPQDCRLRVLEIGAGTGGTTAALLPVLPEGRTEYLFTDISPHFVRQAAEAFRDTPWLRCAVLDIERAPTEQGFRPQGQDLVVAANVLHATRDLREALRHARELLAPGGMLVLLEGTAPLRFIDLTFGLTEGWWRFADTTLRPSHPLLPAERWRDMLGECGFGPAAMLAAPPGSGRLWSTQALIVARAEARARAAPRRWFLLGHEGVALPEALSRRLEAEGDAVTRVYPGAARECLADGAIRIDRRSPDDYRWLLEQARGLATAGIVDLWAAGGEEAEATDPEAASAHGWETALHLVQATASLPGAMPLWLVTRGAQPGGRLAGLAHAPLWGLAKVANLEHPDRRCICIDLDEGDDAAAADALAAEIGGGGATEDQVAFRGGERRVARLVRHHAGAAPRGASICPDGTYLVTGGQGGLGLATAAWLVEAGARSLVLVGRRDAGDTIAPDLAAMRRAGARVELMQADVGDARQVAGLLARVADGLPPLRGVFHAAGVLDDGILAQQTPDRFRRVLAPKAHGAWHLHRLTRGQPLDLFVLYSSLASMLGSAGQANHAAANAFLDALAHHRRAQGLPALSVNWGVWSEIGAAARHGVSQRVGGLGMGTIAPAQGLRILGHLLATEAVQVGVAPIDWTVFARQSRGDRSPPFFAAFAAAATASPDAAPPAAAAGDPAVVVPGRAALAADLRMHVAGVLRMAAQEVDTARPLNRLGLDSLMAVELRNRLRAHLGLDVPLVRLMEDVSISALAAELAGQAGAADGGAAEPRRSLSDTLPLLSRLDELDDDEVDALLDAVLAEGAELQASTPRAAAAPGGKRQ